MNRLLNVRPMLIFVLISQLFFACANEDFVEEQKLVEDEINEAYVAATIYYEEDGTKTAIVYSKNGDKKTFTNGKKVGHTKEAAPDPLSPPEESTDADSVEVYPDTEWTDDQAVEETTPEEETTTSTDPTQTSTPEEVLYWKDMFDQEWTQSDFRTDYEDALSRSKSANLNHEYYFLGKYIDGLQQVWQATGDNQYLDTALELIRNTMNDAVDVGNGYKGWPDIDG
ncbi:hypothetical protein, partial [Robertkochia aurantiaca]|uniref:hypothetical protein n=1 Tax=Robertkochia aurantiaca TaxID=2873700 RepID=UPI001CCD3F88